MTEQTSKDPLHGITLEMILNELVAHYGWEELGEIIQIKCFTVNPSIKSSLTFFRKTPWARVKVERLYFKYKGIRVPWTKKPPSNSRVKRSSKPSR